MASNKKNVILPTAEQLDSFLERLLYEWVVNDEGFNNYDVGKSPSDLMVYRPESDTAQCVYNYLESLHPSVYKNKTVKHKVGRQGLK